MADTKIQNRPSEQQRGVARSDYPSRDIFNFSPFAMMRRLSEEMDRALASTFGMTSGMGESGMWAPPVEVRERDGRLEITAELPGLKKDDVKVECTDQGIIIEGEKRREHEETHGGYHRSERSYGRFYRSIPLPEGADGEKAKADFKDGVLHIEVPVADSKPRSKQIPINT